jgi:DNA-binding CsgD family transcriptional regulator
MRRKIARSRNPKKLGFSSRSRRYACVVATVRDRDRCRERLERLSESSLDRASIQREAIADLRRVIGFDRWCWPLADPEALVPLGAGVAEHDYGPAVGRSLELEYSGGDVAAMGVLARRANPVASLSVETRRDLARSSRWDEVLRPVGIGDEAVVACRDTHGCWGWIKAYRDTADASFAEDDLELLTRVAPALGSALRRTLGDASPDPLTKPSSPGVLVLDRDLRAVNWTAGAREWFNALPLAGLFAAWGILPAVVYPVAALARSQRSSKGAHALERTADGRWLRIEAAPLDGQPNAQIAVTVRAATATETFELLCRVYALSRRERDVVAALLAGLDTRAVSARLYISPHTVQDHLKSVFTKTGVHSRRELLSRFNAAYTPSA